MANALFVRGYYRRKKEKDVATSEAIQQDVQAEDVAELFVPLVDSLFIGPIFTQEKREAIERKKTFIAKHLFEKQGPGFIGPININYFEQRIWAYKWCDLLLKEPISYEWAEASNTTRGLWEDWWATCEKLVKQLKQLPLNYLQVPVIRELESKLKETFDFFINRKIDVFSRNRYQN